MKKSIKSILLSLLLVPVLFVFGACDKTKNKTPEDPPAPEDTRVTLASSHISVPDIEYDGTAKEPVVTVSANNQVVPASNYTVAYSNNVEVGTGTVTVTAKQDSTIIKGSATKNFEIIPHYEEVGDVEAFKAAILSASATVKKFIRLTADLPAVAETSRIEIAFEHAANVSIDLNEKKIENILKFGKAANGQDAAVYVKISNGAISKAELDRGLVIVGDNFNVELDNVTCDGLNYTIETNGLCSNNIISATNCQFGHYGDNHNEHDSTIIPAYLPASGTYTMTNCTFKGLSPYGVKSGEHLLTSCTFEAVEAACEPVVRGDGMNSDGSAILIESNPVYHEPISVTISGGSISSLHNYCVEAYKGEGAQNATIKFEGNVHINCPEKTEPVKVYDGATVEGLEDCTYEVASYEELQAAINYGKIVNILLKEDIEAATSGINGVLFIAKASTNPLVNGNANDRDMDVSIDLGGHTIHREIYIDNNAEGETHKLHVKLFNGDIKLESTTQDFSTTYGIGLIGDKNIDVELINVNASGMAGGLTISGLAAGASLTATKCTFEASGEDGAGVYLACGKNVTFNSCTLTGDCAAVIKGGDVTFNQCTLTGNGNQCAAQPSNGAYMATGSAILIESREDYKEESISVFVNGGTLTSQNNYAVQEFIGNGTVTKTTQIRIYNVKVYCADEENPYFTSSEGLVEVSGNTTVQAAA